MAHVHIGVSRILANHHGATQRRLSHRERRIRAMPKKSRWFSFHSTVALDKLRAHSPVPPVMSRDPVPEQLSPMRVALRDMVVVAGRRL